MFVMRSSQSKMFSGRIVAQAARSAAPRAPIAPRAAIRSYAQAVSSTSTKPPVPLYGIDGTYASALVCQASSTAPMLRQLFFLRMAWRSTQTPPS